MAEIDYGYGDAGPDMGYGDAAPDGPDMGYGEARPDTDYGYGDDADPYGYGDDAQGAEQAAPKGDRRPKRRCSVTKFSLSTETPVLAADVINNFRKGVDSTPAPTTDQAYDDDGKSAVTSDTASMDHEPVEQAKILRKKKGVMGRIRRRLSIAA